MPDLPKAQFQPSMTNFFLFSLIFVAIVSICVFAGGYTSFMRSNNRIKASTSYLTDACQKRLDLLPELISIAKKNSPPITAVEVTRAAEDAKNILQAVISKQTPIEKELIQAFEQTEVELIVQIKNLLNKLESLSDTPLQQQFRNWKEKFYLAQDNVFVTKRRYNSEVAYFNTRKSSMLPSLFAKLYGFNKLIHMPLSQDLFLPAKETFGSKTS